MSWFSPGRLLDAMVPGQMDAEAQMAAQLVLSDAKAQNILNVGQRLKLQLYDTHQAMETLTLNPTHPKVKEAKLLIRRTQAILRGALDRLPFAAFSFVASLLEQDTELAQAGLVRTRPAQIQLLNLLVDVGLICKERRTTPYDCSVLLLPQERLALLTADHPATIPPMLSLDSDG
jgi:hypothetical protein